MKATSLLVALASFAMASTVSATEPTTAPGRAANPEHIALTRMSPPSYPEQARRECAQGKVLVAVRVDEQSRLRKAKLQQSSGNALLDASALEAVKDSTFRAAMVDGAPKGGDAIIPVVFMDPCEMELPIEDPRVSLQPPADWDFKASPAGWEPYEDTSGRTQHPPKYPKAALAACAGGVVQLRVKVSVEGYIKNIAVENSSGNASLDAAAAEAAKHWVYRPGRHGSTAVGGDVIVPVHFKAPC
jgi:TonB family protein